MPGKPLLYVLSAILIGMPLPPSAKRLPPKPVSPVYTSTLRIEAPLDNGREARICAYDRVDGRLLWSVAVFEQRIDPNLEEDVQWRFITQMEIDGDAVVVTAEGGSVYRVSLTTLIVERLWPLRM
ncbi:MAG: PQQ-like beta-propeller repeat protein [Acidobacteriaceae bacterium]|nr:PQQ-like beta-propeller repeat protein [Acidobacteriaceae bacterium]